MFYSFYHSTDQNMGFGFFSDFRFARRGVSLISQQGAGVEELQNEEEVSVILLLSYTQLQTGFQSVCCLVTHKAWFLQVKENIKNTKGL